LRVALGGLKSLIGGTVCALRTGETTAREMRQRTDCELADGDGTGVTFGAARTIPV